jgi:hypothetical protein
LIAPRRAFAGHARRIPLPTLALSAVVSLTAFVHAALPVEVLESVAALPPHLAGRFHEPGGFTQTETGNYLVFDRRGHSVHGVDAGMSAVRRLVALGHEEGRVIRPIAFSAAADGSFVVADAPGGRQRLQVFTADGQRLRGFFLPDRSDPLIVFGALVLNGIGSVHYDGDTILMNQTAAGSLIVEYLIDGTVKRTIGALRTTAFENDEALRSALNTGLPLVHPDGGLYFVFQTGEPRFRRYAADGRLIFERTIQGRELDGVVAAQPTRWPTRRRGDREYPVVAPVVRAAAVDRDGRLWVTLVVPFTYVFDQDGEKVRVVQFRGAGMIAPTSLSFSPGGKLLVTPGCYIFDPRSKQRDPMRASGG